MNSEHDQQQEFMVQAYRQLLASLSMHLEKPICLADSDKNLLWTNSAWGRERTTIVTSTLNDWADVELEVGKTDVLFGRRQKPGYLEIYKLGNDDIRLWLLVFMADNADPLEQRYNKIQTKMLEAQQLESLGVLAARFAHDFSNLLTAILGNADFIAEAMADGKADNASSRQAIQSVIAASELSADMCRQLLAYAGQRHVDALSDDEPADEDSDVELSGLVRDMNRMIQVVTSQRADVILDLNSDAEKLPADNGVLVRGNATHLRQLALNLIINAAEAMRQPGLITVRTGYLDASPQSLAATLFPDVSPGRYAYLEVVDDGAGMSAETLASIFDPFFTTKDSGRGLGLAAVFSIVQAHKGTLAVTSSSSGSSFRVMLPAA